MKYFFLLLGILLFSPKIFSKHPSLDERFTELEAKNKIVECYSNVCGGNIPDRTILGGNSFKNGTFPDIIIDKSNPDLRDFLHEIKTIASHTQDYFSLINKIESKIQKRIKHFDYGSKYREDRTLACGKIDESSKKSADFVGSCQLGQLLKDGVGDCRVNNMLLHLALEAVGISSEYVYAEVESNIPRMSREDKKSKTREFKVTSTQGVFSEDHAMVRIKDPKSGKALILDAYFPYFNGVYEEDIMKGSSNPSRVKGILNSHESNTPRDNLIKKPGIEYFYNELLMAQKDNKLIPQLQGMTSDELKKIAENEYYRRDQGGLGGYRKINKYLGFPQVIVQVKDDEKINCYRNRIISLLQQKKILDSTRAPIHFIEPDVNLAIPCNFPKKDNAKNILHAIGRHIINKTDLDNLLSQAKDAYDKQRNANPCTSLCGRCQANVPTENPALATSYPSWMDSMSTAQASLQMNPAKMCRNQNFKENFKKALDLLSKGNPKTETAIIKYLLKSGSDASLQQLIHSLIECR